MRLATVVPQPVTIRFPLVSKISSATISVIRVPVATDLDDAREPVRLYPGSGGAKDEGLGHRTVSVAVHVPARHPGRAVLSEGSWPAVVAVTVPPLANANRAGKVLSTAPSDSR